MADDLDEMEEFTEEELKQMREETSLPESGEDTASNEAGDTDETQTPEDQASKQEASKEDSEGEDDSEGDGDGDEEFNSFLERHKGKSQEELLQLAYNQNRARQEARQESKQRGENLNALMERINQARQQKQQQGQQERQQFEQELQNDPDSATRKLFERMKQQEEQQFEQQAWSEFVQEQTRRTREAIPDFDEAKEDIAKYAVENLGYDPQEVAQAADSRAFIAVDKSRRFDALVNQGVIDQRGNPVQTAQGGNQGNQQAAEQISRMQGQKQAPRSLSSARGKGTDGGNSLQARAKELISMDDEDFTAAADDNEINKLLKELGG